MRHVEEIIQRDAKEIEGLIRAAQEVKTGVQEMLNYSPKQFYRFMGTLNDDWSLFDHDVFTVGQH